MPVALAGALLLAPVTAPPASGAGVPAGSTVSAGDFPWSDPSLPPDRRAALVLAELTLEEKVELMTGDQGEAPSAFYNGPIPRLGIPELRMADAGGGIAPRGWTLPGTGERATAFPAGVNLGATWSPRIAASYGAAVAVEARATGHQMLLGPGSDLGRQPFWGRIGESMSEDPELTSALVVPYVRQVQRHHVIDDLKHYAGYTQEVGRGAGQNDVVDGRALREVYTLAYGDAVRQAGLGAVMCSFNRVGGVYACENDLLLDRILRQELGFTGFVITDYGAIHSTVASLTAGTDLETGTAAYYGDRLLDAVRDGTVPQALVDGAVLRILRTMFAVGVFDTDYTPGALPVREHGALARQVQDEAVTLLRNRRHGLPLPAGTRSLAVIGADATATAGIGGSFSVTPTYQVSPLQGLEDRAARSGVSVRYAPGNDPVGPANMIETADLTAVPSSVLSPDGGTGHGLTARHYPDTGFGGTPLERTEAQVQYDTGFTAGSPAFARFYASQVPPVPALTGNPFAAGQSATWTGTLTAPGTGSYRLGLTGWGDARLFVGGTLVADMTGVNGRRSVDGTVDLVAGRSYPIRVEYAATRPLVPLQPGTLLLQWAPPAGAPSPGVRDAVRAAKDSDVAVVYLRTYETEERDRVSLKLPQGADALVRAVARANPRTVVVLASAGPVTMPWLGSVRSVLQTYAGGQEEGTSLASVVFGDVNPSGHLPQTYPRSERDLPPGVGNPWDGGPDVPFAEGVDVGYRGYLSSGTEPLFAFGHGLSYTTFRLDRLDVGDLSASRRDRGVRVSFDVRNTGRRAGAEVVQVYVGALPGVAAPVRKLAGFAKVDLRPGERTRVRLTLDRRSFSFWDEDGGRWVTPRGSVRVLVGTSSADIALTGRVAVR